MLRSYYAAIPSVLPLIPSVLLSVRLSLQTDSEITSRLTKAGIAFGKLQRRLWGVHDVSLKTKIAFYRAVALTTLLYGCETWTLYRRSIRRLDQFYLRCLRKIARAIGGASYGAKGLKPLQFLLQPLQNFCVLQYTVSRSIFLWTKNKNCCHRLSYFKAKIHQNQLATDPTSWI